MATISKYTNMEGEPSYRVRIRLKGYPIQSATFSRLTDAKKWAAETETDIRHGRHFKTAEAKKRTLAELIDRYTRDVLPHKPKMIRCQAYQFNWWKSQIGHLALAEVTPAVIAECRDLLIQQRSPATVVRYLSALSAAFNEAIREWLWLDENPTIKVKKPKEPRGRVRFLDDVERAKLLQACKNSSNQYLYLCVVLALSTGMRQGELMRLEWNDINLKDGYLILHETKNGERRRVALAGHALELLQRHNKIRRLDTNLLFPGSNISKPVDLRKPFSNALKEAEIYDFRWHDLRHCTASYLAMNGASLAEIAEVLGHKTLQMVKRYSHLSDGHLSTVVTSMNAKIFEDCI